MSLPPALVEVIQKVWIQEHLFQRRLTKAKKPYFSLKSEVKAGAKSQLPDAGVL
jgi:hypothetical protein